MRVSYSCRGTRTLHHSPKVPQARPRELDAAAKVAAQPIGLFVQEDHAAARRALKDCVEGGERASHAQVHLDDDLINSKPAGSALLPQTVGTNQAAAELATFRVNLRNRQMVMAASSTAEEASAAREQFGERA